MLLQKAIGDQLTCIFVDHGLLRKGEAEQVMESLGGKFGLNIIKVDAKERFLSKLAGVSDPEQKRKIIGNEFVYVFDDEATKLAGEEGVSFLAQGTLYTDVIESGTETAQTIKSHHNVGGLPEDMQFELIEPLNTLFKDEVRALGTELGMPDAIVWRQPFPGPGLGIRVLGEITEDKLQIVRDSDAILREEIAAAGLDRDIWQYFTVLPGIRSVGVMGDGRTYDYTVGIRAVTSIDGMTADFARILGMFYKNLCAHRERSCTCKPYRVRYYFKTTCNCGVGIIKETVNPLNIKGFTVILLVQPFCNQP